MSEFKLPHVENLRTDATLIRGLQEDFKAIEQANTDIFNRLEMLEKKIKQNSDFDNHLYD